MKKLFTLLIMLLAVAVNGMAANYEVVGSSVVCNGENWNFNAAANLMTTVDEGATYSLTIEGLTLEAGINYEYKIVEKGSWTEYYPNTGSNAKFFVTENGIYTIKYVYTVATSSCEVQTTKTGDVAPIAHVYSIAGDNAYFFGASWDASSTSTDMTEVSTGNYAWLKTDFTFGAEEVKFKVVQDHSWDVSYPSQDYKFTAGEGKKNVLITFNSETKAIGVYCYQTFTVAGDSPLLPKSWDATDTDADMMLDGYEYKLNVTNKILPAGTYKFKVAKDHAWTQAYPDENYELTIDADGQYDVEFTFNLVTKAVNAVATKKADVVFKYYVTGDEAITKYNWDSDQNLMAVDAGTATLQLTDLDITKDVYNKFKIVRKAYVGEEVKQVDWLGDPDNGGSDYVVNLSKTSRYTIDYSLDLTTGKATATPTEQFTGYYLVRSDEYWKPSISPLTPHPSTPSSYIAVIDNKPGISFIVAPNTAIGADGNIADWDACKRPTANTTLGFGNFKGEYGVGGEANWTIENGVPNKNDGILTIEIQDSKWEITCNQTIPMTSAGYATYSNVYDYGIYDGIPYIVKQVGGAMKLVAVENPLHIPGGTGVVVAKKENKEKFYVFGTSGDESNVSGNLLIGSNNYDYEITGTYDGVKEYTPYIFANGKNGVGFYLISGFNGKQTIGAHKAFLALPKGAGAREFIGFDETGEATGISASLNEKGEMVNKKVFNLSGQRVSQPTKGLYIVNGKKFVK